MKVRKVDDSKGATKPLIVGYETASKRLLLNAFGPECSALLQKNEATNPKVVFIYLANAAVKRFKEDKIFFRLYAFKFQTQDDADVFYSFVNPNNVEEDVVVQDDSDEEEVVDEDEDDEDNHESQNAEEEEESEEEYVVNGDMNFTQDFPDLIMPFGKNKW